MKYLFLIFAFIVFNLNLLGQNGTYSDEVFTVVEEMPRFSGCEEVYDSISREMNSFVKTRSAREQCALRKLDDFLSAIQYPIEAKKNNQEGTVFIRFVVDITGDLIDHEIAKTSGHKILDEAAVNHFKTSPKWIPGKQRGKNVKVRYIAPVNFKL